MSFSKDKDKYSIAGRDYTKSEFLKQINNIDIFGISPILHANILVHLAINTNFKSLIAPFFELLKQKDYVNRIGYKTFFSTSFSNRFPFVHLSFDRKINYSEDLRLDRIIHEITVYETNHKNLRKKLFIGYTLLSSCIITYLSVKNELSTINLGLSLLHPISSYAILNEIYNYHPPHKDHVIENFLLSNAACTLFLIAMASSTSDVCFILIATNSYIIGLSETIYTIYKKNKEESICNQQGFCQKFVASTLVNYSYSERN